MKLKIFIVAVLFLTSFARADDPVTSGWTGTVTTRSVATTSVHRDGYIATGKTIRYSRLTLTDRGLSAYATYSDTQDTSSQNESSHDISAAQGSATPDGAADISANANNHLLINIQQLGLELKGTDTGWSKRGKDKNSWNDPKNFTANFSDAEDPNSTPSSTTLNGTKTTTEPAVGDGPETVTTVDWHLNLKSNLRLLITIDNYETWQPQATTDESKKGSTLHLHAILQNKDGTPTTEKADAITFELADVSAIPGTAINFPAASKSTPKKDLKFDPDDNSTLDITGDENQTAKTKTSQLTEADATLACYDWAAYGTISVYATVGDRRIYGTLQSDPGTLDIRIPKRAAASHIADAWKKANSIADDVADNADADDTPKSKVLDGDGLTLFEEYRGLYENGKHLSTDPHTKDLFVFDKSTGKCQPGIDLLAKISDIKIHSHLTKEEFPENRIINFNQDPAAHAVDQHGIFLTVNSAYGDSEAAGKKGKLRCPADIDHDVEIFNIDPAVRGPVKAAREFNVTVAHELLHCMGVDHHGDKDQRVVEWQKRADGSFYEYALNTDASGNPTITGSVGSPITICDDSLHPLTEAQVSALVLHWPLRLYVAAEKDGEHSGDIHCVMRYNSCNAYAKADKRILLSDYEPLGTDLCTSPDGTGFNAPENPNGSRHGPASTGRGDCKSQITINDKRAQNP